MGEWHPAEEAWMVPVMDGKIPDSDPNRPTIPSLYKVKASQVKAFQAKFNKHGAYWHPIYSVQDATDFLSLNPPKMYVLTPGEENDVTDI